MFFKKSLTKGTLILKEEMVKMTVMMTMKERKMELKTEGKVCAAFRLNLSSGIDALYTNIFIALLHYCLCSVYCQFNVICHK